MAGLLSLPSSSKGDITDCAEQKLDDEWRREPSGLCEPYSISKVGTKSLCPFHEGIGSFMEPRCNLWGESLSRRGQNTKHKNKTNPQNQSKTNQQKHKDGDSLLKVSLNVHAQVRQRVKPRLGNELEQKGHEVGHPKCGTNACWHIMTLGQ